MAVFVGDSKNTNAAKTGLQITWAVNKIINPGLRAQYGDDAYEVTHVVGVDSSIIRAARADLKVNGNPKQNMWTEMTYDGNTVYRSRWQWGI
jgi:hypothetical protein